MIKKHLINLVLSERLACYGKGEFIMKKEIDKNNNHVFYTINWSKIFKYDRLSASRVLPELPGILYFYDAAGDTLINLFCFAGWREGLRISMKNIFDPLFSNCLNIAKLMEERNLYYKYCVVDTSMKDLQDIVFWIIQNYNPKFNNEFYKDSQRYKEIAVLEKQMSKTGIR